MDLRVKLPAKKAKDEQPQLPLPFSPDDPEELKKRFWQAEGERTQTYETIRRQQLHDLVSSATQWNDDEVTREDTFRRLVSQTQDTFALHQVKRDTMLQDVLSRHHTIFRTNEQHRDAAFQTALEGCQKVFQVSQDKREKTIRNLGVFQEELFEKGKSSRQADCRQLVEQFSEKFRQLIQGEKSAFESAQNARHQRLLSVVRTATDGEKKESREDRSSQGNASPSPEPAGRSPPRPLPDSSIQRVQSPLRSPTRTLSIPEDDPNVKIVASCSHPSGAGGPVTRQLQESGLNANPAVERQLQVPPQPDTSDLNPSAEPRGSLQETPSPRSGSLSHQAVSVRKGDLPNTSDSRSSSPFVTPKIAPTEDLLHDLDRIFDERENRRQVESSKDRAYQEDLVKQIKESIAGGGERRDVLLKYLEEAMESEFRRSQEHYDEIIQTHDVGRATGEASREMAWKDTELQMDTLFNSTLSLLETQSASIETLQDLHVESCVEEIKGLRQGMNAIVRGTRVMFQLDFELLLAKHGHPSHRPTQDPSSSSPTDSSDPDHPSRPNYSFFRLRPRRHFGAEEGIESQNEERSDQPAPEPASDKLFSPTVFLQGSIFNSDLVTSANVTKLLPQSRPQELKAESEAPAPAITTPAISRPRGFHHHLAIFTEFQTERSAQFSDQMHKNHEEITALLLQSLLDFEKRLSSFEKRVRLKWVEYTSEFQASQCRRDAEFHAKENERQHRFEGLLQSMKASFTELEQRYESQFVQDWVSARDGTIEAEKQRVKAFVKWREECKVRLEVGLWEWRREFAADEMQRQGTIATITRGRGRLDESWLPKYLTGWLLLLFSLFRDQGMPQVL